VRKETGELREVTKMIESFLYTTWILGQAVYWSFLKFETEIACEESWTKCLRAMRPARVV